MLQKVFGALHIPGILEGWECVCVGAVGCEGYVSYVLYSQRLHIDKLGVFKSKYFPRLPQRFNFETGFQDINLSYVFHFL
jgi:hypothetical protein